MLVTVQTGDHYLLQREAVSGPGPEVQLRVAVVKPVFTATAYASFYYFYGKYAGTPKGQFVTSDVGLLDHVVVNSWGWSDGLRQFLASKDAIAHGLIRGRTLTVLTDVSVTEGGLYDQYGSRKFDVVILGFTEYVTSKQYHAYKHFVATGGRLILLDATNFLAEVKYHPGNQHISLVKGHSWGFDGKKAWRDVIDRWRDENTNWVASTFFYSGQRQYAGALVSRIHTIGWKLWHEFGPRVFTSYSAHEENIVTNMTGTVILANWVTSNPDRFNTTLSQNIVAAYLHHYLKGLVIHIGVMGSDVVLRDRSVQSFLVNAIFEPDRLR